MKCVDHTLGAFLVVFWVTDLPAAEQPAAQTKILPFLARAEQLKPYVDAKPALTRMNSAPEPTKRPLGHPSPAAPSGSGRRLPASVPSPAVSRATAAALEETSEIDREIMNEVLDSSAGVPWSAIAGLEYAKEQLVM